MKLSSLMTIAYLITMPVLAAAQDWQKDLAKLSDKGFIGALSNEDVALAKSVADTIRPQLDGPNMNCGQPDPMRGVEIGNFNIQKMQTPEGLLQGVPTPLIPLLEMTGKDRHHQEAVALYVIYELGPKALTAKPYIDWLFNHNSGWSAWALEGITCERYGAPTLWDFAKALNVNLGMDPAHCRPEYLPKIFAYALDDRLNWPKDSIKDTISGGSTNCSVVDSPDPLGSDLIGKIRTILNNTAISEARKNEILEIIEERWPSQALELKSELEHLLQSKNEDLAFTTQRLIVSTGTSQSSEIFSQWLRLGYRHTLWTDYIPALKNQKHKITDVLVETLHSPYWDQREAAAKAIGDLDLKAKIPELIKAIRNDDWVLTDAVITALKPYSSSNAEANVALREIADSYWSPYVRTHARTAFGQPEPTKSESDEERIEAGFKSVDHGLQTCKIAETKHWFFPDGTTRTINWIKPQRKPLPRGEFKDVSSWCVGGGEFAIQEVVDGWVAGCSGFEMDGGLAFLPKDHNKPIKQIARITTTGILEFKGELFVTGLNWFGLGSQDPGHLFKLIRKGDDWELQPFIALPAMSDAVAISGDYMIFDDKYSTVAVDSSRNIYPLSCR